MSRSRRSFSPSARGWLGRRRPATAVVVLGLLSAACSTVDSGQLTSSAEPGTGPLASTVDTTATSVPQQVEPPSSDRPATDSFAVAPVDWRRCGDVECADLEVPLDHQNPDGATITIAMTRLLSTGSADERIGSLFVNFGGPGAEGTETIQSYAVAIPRSLRERFDIISWDPRGIEDTAGLGCDGEIGDEPSELIDPEDGFADDIAAARVVWDRVMSCVATSPILDHLSTVDVAVDLDYMRQAVGDDELTYLGFSYGTEIGWVYATFFPDSVRAMVLDGAVPPSEGTDDLDLSQLTAIEAAIGRWDQGCDQAPDCPLRGEGYESTILRLMDQLEDDPISLPDGTTFGPNDLGNLVVSMTYLDQTDWGPPFVDAVAALDRGDVEPIAGIAALFEGGFEEATFWSVLCADGTEVLPDGDYESVYAEALAISPIVGRLTGNQVFCDTYPGRIVGLPAVDSAGAPTLLVIGNTGDNATPYADAVRLDQLLADSVLLTYDGPGHTITFSDECVDAIVIDYFVDLVTPAAGTRCGNPSTTPDGWYVPIRE